MLDLFYHPFSSYSQKVLIVLYENEIPFNGRLLAPEHPDAATEMHALWPLNRFPVLRAGTRAVVEATAIIEFLEVHHHGPTHFIPRDPDDAIEVRMRDRIFDNYVMNPVQTIVFNARREDKHRDSYGVDEARAMLDKIYAWLNAEMADQEWACGDRFTLADCAAAPSLFYADWAHPIGAHYPNLRGYRKRLNARPAFARAIDGGRPYRQFFPLGAPDRD